MTPAELNEAYEVITLMNFGLKLIIRRAKKIQTVCQDIKSSYSDIKAAGLKCSNDILEMVASIEKRKEPFLEMIEVQRKELNGQI